MALPEPSKTITIYVRGREQLEFLEVFVALGGWKSLSEYFVWTLNNDIEAMEDWARDQLHVAKTELKIASCIKAKETR